MKSLFEVYCAKCSKPIPEDNPRRLRFRRNSRPIKCDACFDPQEARSQRNKGLLKEYGITVDQFDAMLAKQGNKCAICRTDTPGGFNNVFCVDHCHKTGRIRGILCHRCNLTLAAVGDDMDGLMRFWVYLKKEEPRPIKPQIPKRSSYVRYYDSDGKIVKKGTPGAIRVKTPTKMFYILVGDKRVSLKTRDEKEAWKRLRRMIERSTAKPW